MAAHLRPYGKKCARCDRVATQELRNMVNAIIDWYCDRHARVALADFKKSETR
jgi:hypothetical protein